MSRFSALQPLDDDLTAKIGAIIKRRRSVDAVHSEQSQWVGPSTFSYKAEVDFDGTWLAAQVCFCGLEPVIAACSADQIGRCM